MLRKCPVLQYLYYLKQIGLALSPISNSRLFVKYNKNPFPEFFRKGLNVTLSTDNPLMFHRTREPLLEEYSVAAQVFELNQVDLAEISYNSVIQSGFNMNFKQKCLGENYFKGDLKNMHPKKSNLSNIRWAYRLHTFKEEYNYISKIN